MYRFIIYLLFFFIAFTHTTVAMDIHTSNILGQESASIKKGPSKFLSENVNLEWHDNLNQHCSHSSSHTTGIFSLILLTSVDAQRVFNSLVKTSVYTVFQSPLLRPPKA